MLRVLRPLLLPAALAALAAFAPGRAAAQTESFRPPAVPLVTFNPYLSIWSEADKLTDDNTRHWTHREHALASLIRIDGKPYRLMGKEPEAVPALPQVGLEVLPTRSIYQFDNGAVHVTLTFMTTALPDDLEAFGRPLTYLTWNVRSMDGAAHDVSIYDSVSSQLAVNTPNQPVEWKRETIPVMKVRGKIVLPLISGEVDQQVGSLTALRVGTKAQAILGSSGDDHRIDWGYAYAVAPTSQTHSAIGDNAALLQGFADNGSLSEIADQKMPRPANENQPVLAFTFDLGKVGAESVSRHLMVGYDEIYSIKYFGHNLRPYWRRNGMDAPALVSGGGKRLRGPDGRNAKNSIRSSWRI